MSRHITILPETARTPEEITGFVLEENGKKEIFNIGDPVTVTHRPTGSRIVATIGPTYGVGRIAGFRLLDAPFNATAPFNFYGENNYYLEHRSGEGVTD